MEIKDSSHCRKSNPQAEIANWTRRVATITMNLYYRCTSSDTGTEQAQVMEKLHVLSCGRFLVFQEERRRSTCAGGWVGRRFGRKREIDKLILSNLIIR